MTPRAREPARRIAPIYGPPGEGGEIILYAGDLELQSGGQFGTLHGQVELRLYPAPDLKARVAGSGTDLLRLTFGDSLGSTALPAQASLAPPQSSTPPEQPEGTQWADAWIAARGLTGGTLASAERLLLHYSGAFEPRFRAMTDLEGGGTQGQIPFELPGWRLVVAPVDEAASDARGFSGAIEATPTGSRIDLADVNRLSYRLFILLSLTASREVAIGPICGLDSDGDVVWVRWDSPRMRRGRGVGWCPRHLIPTALPVLAGGYVSLSGDRATEVVFERAAEALLFADSDQVVDVRVPIACGALELLAWWLLPRHGVIDESDLDNLKAGTAVRRLLEWAGIPEGVPEHLEALSARRDVLGQRGWGGPEVVFNVRNRLIHPPKNRADPEWPGHDVLVESWQLSLWYLQLAILRLLDYSGEYRTALHFGGSEAATEPVPWAAQPNPTSAGRYQPTRPKPATNR